MEISKICKGYIGYCESMEEIEIESNRINRTVGFNMTGSFFYNE